MKVTHIPTMKRLRPAASVLIFQAASLCMPAGEIHGQPEPGKHALVITIGDYDLQLTGWRKLSNIKNDLRNVRRVLVRQGFPERNIDSLMNQDATKEGILAALRRLRDKVNLGDVAVIHVSSHGQQLADDNGDEADDYDECIVPINAKTPARTIHFDEEQANYLRDDLFGLMVDSIRMRMGRNGDLLVVLDMCHSGSGTRGLEVRGDETPLVPKGFKPSLKAGPPNDDDVFVDENGRGTTPNLASYVVISGSLPQKPSFGTKDVNGERIGALTYALCRTLEKLVGAQVSYRNLFSRLASEMVRISPNQQPVLEGTGVDRMVFGGRYITQKPFQTITRQDPDTRELTVDGGTLLGLDEGATIYLCDNQTTDPGKGGKIDSGVVVRSNAFGSTVRLHGMTLLPDIRDARVFTKEQVFKMDPVALRIPDASNTAWSGCGSTALYSTEESARIESSLAGIPFVTLSGEPDLVLEKGEGVFDRLSVATGCITFRKLDATNSAQLRDAIRGYAQYSYLLNAEGSNGMRLEADVVPVRRGNPDTTPGASIGIGGIPEFKVGDTVTLVFRNRGTDSVFFNLIDLPSDGNVKCLLPNESFKLRMEDLKIRAGERKYWSTCRFITDIPGLQVLKVFALDKPFDLSNVIGMRGNGKGNLTGFERFLNESFFSDTRSDRKNTVKISEGAAFNIPFRVVPRGEGN